MKSVEVRQRQYHLFQLCYFVFYHSYANSGITVLQIWCVRDRASIGLGFPWICLDGEGGYNQRANLYDLCLELSSPLYAGVGVPRVLNRRCRNGGKNFAVVFYSPVNIREFANCA